MNIFANIHRYRQGPSLHRYHMYLPMHAALLALPTYNLQAALGLAALFHTSHGEIGK